MIAVYAPTLSDSKTNPSTTENFYALLYNTVKNVSRRDILIVAGDWNAKLGSSSDRNDRNLGLYGKGTLNENGNKLIELMRFHDLVATNTIFYQKMSHRTN